MTGMRAEERRTMIAPPALSKRTHYLQSFSPGNTLYYDVELVEIEP